MSTLYAKICRNISRLKSEYKDNCAFSKKYARYKLSSSVFWLLRLKSISDKYRTKVDEWILNYLNNKLSDVIVNFENDTETGVYTENAPIWVCWWTGEDSAPLLVKQCIRSICKHAGKHNVYIITKYNYMNFIDIPLYILDKVEAGNMKLAHLSDYIRVSLLEKYGGLWLDATIFCSSKIPEDYFSYSFFTCKSSWQDCGYISHMQWATFVLGGWKNNIVYRFIKEAFETYWSTENAAVDYLMFDYIIYIAFCNLSGVRECIENVHLNNLHRDDLQAAMNRALSAEDFDRVIKEDTVLYKLSWRETYSPVTADGNKSIYAHFLERNF